jgi:hypothetical protein
MPLVHIVLVDPVPEARATAAKALGTLIERLGEVNFPDMVDNLLQTLKTDTSGVDRQGAAQGLSEVLSGLGMERMEGLLPEVITSISSPRPYVREGFMSLLVYLPATFGHRFTPHLARIIPPILSGLADSEESVRSASMKAGRMIVTNYSSKAIDLLLPELEKGMFDSGWRIRVRDVLLPINEDIDEELLALFHYPCWRTALPCIRYQRKSRNRRGRRGSYRYHCGRKLASCTHRSTWKGAQGPCARSSIHRSSRRCCSRPSCIHSYLEGTCGQYTKNRYVQLHVCACQLVDYCITVRDLLPTLIDQIVNLLASPDSDQREV